MREGKISRSQLQRLLGFHAHGSRCLEIGMRGPEKPYIM